MNHEAALDSSSFIEIKPALEDLLERLTPEVQERTAELLKGKNAIGVEFFQVFWGYRESTALFRLRRLARQKEERENTPQPYLEPNFVITSESALLFLLEDQDYPLSKLLIPKAKPPGRSIKKDEDLPLSAALFKKKKERPQPAQTLYLREKEKQLKRRTKTAGTTAKKRKERPRPEVRQLLLTSEEEVYLFQAFQGEEPFDKTLAVLCSDPKRGIFWQSYLREKIPKFQEIPLDLEEEDKTRIIFEIIMESNIRLVISISKRYKIDDPALEDDLIQAGRKGLERAIEKFDYRRGNRFSTYAVLWMRQAMSRIIENEKKSIKIPYYIQGRISKLNKQIERLAQTLGREPLEEEMIADKNIIAILKFPSDPVKAKGVLQKYFSWMRKIVSLNQPVGEEEEETREDFVTEREPLMQASLPSPEKSFESTQLMREAMKIQREEMDLVLSPREERFIDKRFGLITGETKTLQEIGDEEGLTMERVRQIIKKALGKLRKKSKLEELWSMPMPEVSQEQRWRAASDAWKAFGEEKP